MEKRSILIASGCVAALILAGCGSPDSTSTNTSESASATTTSSTASQATESTSSYPRTIKHFRGETVIPAKPQRIVAIDNSYMEILVALDQPVVGLASSHGQTIPDYFSDEQRALVKDATVIGDIKTPSLEAIAALQPDLIVSSDYRSKDYYDELSKIAPTVFSEKAGTTWQDNVLLMGEVLDEEPQAQALLDNIDNRAQAIGADIRAKGDPGTVSIVRFDPSLRLYRTNSFPGSILAKVGLTQPVNQQADPSQPTEIFTEFSPETVSMAEADTIVAMAPEPGSDRRAQWESKANPVLQSQLWAQLTGRKVEVNDEVWFLNVSPIAANYLLDSVAEIFGVSNHR